MLGWAKVEAAAETKGGAAGEVGVGADGVGVAAGAAFHLSSAQSASKRTDERAREIEERGRDNGRWCHEYFTIFCKGRGSVARKIQSQTPVLGISHLSCPSPIYILIQILTPLHILNRVHQLPDAYYNENFITKLNVDVSHMSSTRVALETPPSNNLVGGSFAS